MAKFTIETTYRLPVFRQRTYDAATLADACRLAIDDDDWSSQKEDYDSSGATFVSGGWEGVDTAYRVPALLVPAQFREPVQHRADLFEVMLGMLKVLAHVEDLQAPDLPTWLPRARAIIARAEAVLEGASEPDADAAEVPGAAYVVLAFTVKDVRRQVVAILETDPDMSTISADAVTDGGIYDACAVVADQMDLTEQRCAGEFRAAFLAIRDAGRHLMSESGGGHDHA